MIDIYNVFFSLSLCPSFFMSRSFVFSRLHNAPFFHIDIYRNFIQWILKFHHWSIHPSLALPHTHTNSHAPSLSCHSQSGSTKTISGMSNYCHNIRSDWSHKTQFHFLCRSTCFDFNKTVYHRFSTIRRLNSNHKKSLRRCSY